MRLVRYLLYLYCVSEQFLSMKNGFKFLKQVESKRSQFEIVFKSLAPFSTQFGVNESFNGLYLLNKLRRFGDKSRNSAATEKILAGCTGEHGPLNWPITACVLRDIIIISYFNTKGKLIKQYSHDYVQITESLFQQTNQTVLAPDIITSIWRLFLITVASKLKS